MTKRKQKPLIAAQVTDEDKAAVALAARLTDSDESTFIRRRVVTDAWRIVQEHAEGKAA
jgi:uncharacterized protein (DUF1778 family)